MLDSLPKEMIGEIEIVYKTTKLYEQSVVRSSVESVEQLRMRWPVDIEYREASVALCLNRANKVVGHAVISVGGINATVIDAKVVFQHGMMCNASGIIISHNHPSNNPKPSSVDIEITKKLVGFGKMIDMPVLDHVILCETGYYSFADEGII